MLKLITTGNQLSPDMIKPDHSPSWGPDIQKVEGDLKTLRNAIPWKPAGPGTAWEVSLKTSVEIHTIFQGTSMRPVEKMDPSLHEVITDFIEEKREAYEEWLEDHAKEDD